MAKCTVFLVLVLLLGSAATVAATPLPFDYLLTVLERIADRLSAIEDKLSTNHNNNRCEVRL